MTPPDADCWRPLESWELELNQPLPEIMRGKDYDYIHSSSVDTRMKETNYKLLMKWYYVPLKLHKINSDLSALCWRGRNSYTYMVATSFNSTILEGSSRVNKED